MTKRILCWSCLCLFIFGLVSCADYLHTSDRFDAGETLTPDQLEEISEEIFSTGADTSDALPDDLSPDTSSDAPNGSPAYWLENSKVYHTDASCYHLRGKENVVKGTTAQAAAAGKTKPCAACSTEKNTESDQDSDRESDQTTDRDTTTDTVTDTDTETDPTPDDPDDPDARVYWLPNGTVYHADPACYRIAGKDNVRSGTAEEAAEAGKTRCCTSCDKP